MVDFLRQLFMETWHIFTDAAPYVIFGFLAAGLVWSLLIADPAHALSVATFFLVCVVVAAIVGALTAAWQILIVQGLPAAAALLALYL